MSLPRLLPKPSDGQPPVAPEPQQSRKRKRGLHHTACNRVTRQQACKEKTQEAVQLTSSFRDVVELLRCGSEADATLALSRIRQAENVNDAVHSLSVARALLVPTASTTGTVARPELQPNEASTTYRPYRPTDRFIASPTEDPQHMFERAYVQARDQYNETEVFIDLPAISLPISRWTSACQDERLLNHLLTLFWTWDCGVQATLFRPMFEEDLVNQPQVFNGDSHSFCSPFLVNALLALGCLFTMEQVTFSDPDDSRTRGRRFAEEAERHFEKEKDHASIPLLQGQYAMFVYEGNLGSGVRSIEFFMQAMKTHAALNQVSFLDTRGQGKTEARLQKEREGLSWVMWGIFKARVPGVRNTKTDIKATCA
ncbi:C6 transcription factor [Stagonosporopsis vannaccii]|nr:C6 transcription factor [Stagonosporopsis vannaccii]